MYSMQPSDAWNPLGRESARPTQKATARRRSPSPAGEAPAPPRDPSARSGLEAVARAALDKLNRGVLLVSGTGEVAFANLAARDMLGRNGGFAVTRGRLEFADPVAQARFAAFLAAARDAEEGASLVLRVAAPKSAAVYRVLVSPLQADEDTPAFGVFVYEPDAGRRPLPPKVLAALYGLSPSEIRLANELFVGRSVQEAAAELGITVNTARSALKRVFGKCAVGSQAELLQLLALGPRTV